MSDYIREKDMLDPYGEWEEDDSDIIEECEWCGAPIRKGQVYYDLWDECGAYVHEDCFEDYFRDKYEDLKREE